MAPRAASILSAAVANSAPSTPFRRPRRAANRSPGAASRRTRVRPSAPIEKPTSGWAMASRLRTSRAWPVSVRSALRNLSRAGVAKNRSRTSIRVPAGWAAGAGADLTPRSSVISQPCAEPAARVTSRTRPTAPIEGSASPRKPSVAMRLRSSSASLEVAWRSTASARSPASMPWPSSATAMAPRPACSSVTSMRRAPASRAFSTSSLTTEAGRSTTSPAAMRLTVASLSTRTVTPGPPRRGGPASCLPRPRAGRRGPRPAPRP